MAKIIKGLLIDPESRTITEVDVVSENGNELDSMYEHLDCSCVDVGRNGLTWLPSKCLDDVWFDDEALLFEPKHFFALPFCDPIAGRGLILGSSNGESTSHTLTANDVESLRRGIKFFEIERKRQ